MYVVPAALLSRQEEPIRLAKDPQVSSARWFALQVRTRWESSTALFLSSKGYETFLPTYKNRKRWVGRVKEVEAPLFPGYVFCHFDAQNRLPILVTPGVVAVVGRGRVPIPVEDAEISAIQTVISSGLHAEPWPYLEIGQRIRVEEDALRGLEGILIDFKGRQRIVISVSLLRRSVSLEIDRSRVRPTVAEITPPPDLVGRHAALQGAGA
jgi:transcription antitermination factor NusG